MAVLDEKMPVYRFFEEISRIPHGSGNEQALSDYLKAFALERGCEVHQDELYNLVIKVPASAGRKQREPLILQAHIDMVCDKNRQTDHDFTKDPLNLYVEDGWLKARGTTLGADDGCGVAYIMSVIDDKELVHPPLECVLTVQEETGMQGAAGLDYSLLSGRRMLGLDCTGENVTIASSAGGLGITLDKTPDVTAAYKETLTFCIKGLLGGHSGIFIDKERGNSIKLAARILYRISLAGLKFGIVRMEGGDKDNAIPRECSVSISCENEDKVKFHSVLEAVKEEIGAELAASDSGFCIEVSDGEPVESMLSPSCSAELIRLLYLLPNGVAAMNMEMPGLVETSDNVGVLKADTEGIHVKVSLRSADDSRLEELRDRIALTAGLFGADLSESGRYPGMQYQTVSPFRDFYKQVMEDIWHRELQVLAGHAGGEGGYFARNLPGLEMVCIGPMISDVHCPDEKVLLSSFAEVYDFIKEFLARA